MYVLQFLLVMNVELSCGYFKPHLSLGFNILYLGVVLLKAMLMYSNTS